MYTRSYTTAAVFYKMCTQICTVDLIYKMCMRNCSGVRKRVMANTYCHLYI